MAAVPNTRANDQETNGFPVSRAFFGSRHGKGPCDGATGVVKAHLETTAAEPTYPLQLVLRDAMTVPEDGQRFQPSEGNISTTASSCSVHSG